MKVLEWKVGRVLCLIGLLSIMLVPLWSGPLFSSSPFDTENLIAIRSALSCELQSERTCQLKPVTLPDSWRRHSADSRRVRYQIHLPFPINREGYGLLIPSYRHHLTVRVNGQLVLESGAKRVGIPKLSMPQQRVMLPVAKDQENYSLVLEVQSNWVKEGGLGPVWLGEYSDLLGRQSFVIGYRKQLMWLAAGTFIALFVYYAVHSIGLGSKSGPFLISLPNFFLVVMCMFDEAPIDAVNWLKLYVTLVVLVMVSWVQQVNEFQGGRLSKANWTATPVVLALIPLWWLELDLDQAYAWHLNMLQPLLVFMGVCYLWVWLRSTVNEPGYSRLRWIVFCVTVLLFSTGMSDLLVSRGIDGDAMVERELSYRYMASSVALLVFFGTANWIVQQTQEVQRRESALNQLVDERTSELLAAQKKLRESEEVESAYILVSGISHEIKQPLGTIQAAVSTIRAVLRAPIAELLSSSLVRIERSVLRIDTAISDLSVHTENKTTRLIPTMLHEWLLAYLDDPLNQQELSRFVVSHSIDDVGQVFCDCEKLDQVMYNLVQNAERACSGQDQKQLYVELYIDGPVAVIRVTDNGTGLDHRVAERVKEPLVSGSSIGMGLGLSFVDRIIRQHGGEFKLHNRDQGEGAVATIALPLGSGHIAIA